MYTGVLHLHSLLRYVVLIVLIIAIFRALAGWLGKRDFSAADNRVGTILIAVTHTQFILGLLLYFISPLTEVIMADFGAAMKDETLRFWAVEHATIMIIAVALITVGRVMSKKATVALVQHKRAAIFYAMGFAAIMSGIPWAERGFFNF